MKTSASPSKNPLAEAEIVLRETGGPLHYAELTQRILDRGQWLTSSKTPATSLSAQLSIDVKKYGLSSRFQRLGNGLIGLRSWESPGSGIGGIAKPIPSGTLSFLDAAERVLEQFGNRQPMHYRTIAEKALKLGLVRTKAQSPEATLNAQITLEIDRQKQRGAIPRFVRPERGKVGLSRWTEQGLASQIAEHNKKIRHRLHEMLLEMPPQQFEALIGRLLVKLGFEEVAVTDYGGDGGIDVRGILVVGGVIRTRMAVQVKRWRQNVPAPVVQQVRGSLDVHDQGLIITTSDFGKGAREEAERPNRQPVALMGGEQLVTLLVEHNIGIRRQPHDLLELDPFADEE